MTRASVVLKSENMEDRCFYVHCDGYPAHMVPHLTTIIKGVGVDPTTLGEVLENAFEDMVEHPTADSDFIYVIDTYKRIIQTHDARWDICDTHGLLRVDTI